MAVTNLEEVVNLLGENAEVSVVGRTAFMVAAERALEAERKDALFEDPFAKALSGSDGLTMSDRLGEAASQFGFDGWPEFHKVWTVVCTKFIDDLISRDTAEIPQMVNLGAGVDTRPYRLDAYKQFKASYEVDTAEVMLRSWAPLAAPGSLAIINYAIGPQRFKSSKLLSYCESEEAIFEHFDGRHCGKVFGDERLNYGRYKEGLAPSEDWAFATCVKGAVGPTPEAQEQ
ncbi:unnamed protein product [Durusdinium trenchii]|uniref:[Phosphatase 2A protein]-leucine-carboxy methyltransferase 1 n=1 Tax=Durusdinium trenchii TaxID=1381693 RepID=A0ABP0SU96_9DINO